MAKSLRIQPKGSRYLALFLYGTHLSAFVLVWFLPLSTPYPLALSGLTVVSLLHAVRVHVSRAAPGAIEAAEWNEDGEWSLVTADGSLLPAELQGSSYVQPWLVILNFSLGRWRRRSLILLPDAVDHDQLRRLRVRLRFEHAKPNEAAPF